MRRGIIWGVGIPAAAALLAVLRYAGGGFGADLAAFTLFPADAIAPVRVGDCGKWEWPRHADWRLLQPLHRSAGCEWTLDREEGQAALEEKTAPWRGERPELRHSFWRSLSAAGDEVDIVQAPHTAAAFARGGAALRAWTQAAIGWRTRPTPYVGCRKCGYSCAQFGNVPPAGFNESYPTRARKASVSVRVLASGRPAPAGSPRVVLQLHGVGANPLAATTAFYQGWMFTQTHASLSRSACKGPVSTVPTFFFSRRKHPELVVGNVGHWLHDVLFPVFSVIQHRIDLTRPGKFPVFDVVAGETYDARIWRKEWAIGHLGYLMHELAPRRVTLRSGMCFTAAYFDCPAANSMAPVRPFQDWLSLRHGFRFAPLGVRAREPQRLLLMLRRPGGSRYLENWEALVASAQSMGFAVDVPLVPGDPHGYATHEMHRIVPMLQKSHVLAGMHGAELAPMLFLPNGSAVVEVVPVSFRYLDTWYVKQSEASGLHLIRWSPSNESVRYWRGAKRKAKGAGKSQQRWEIKMQLLFDKLWEGGSLSEFAVRSLRSNVSLSLPSWRGVLALARALVAASGP